MGDHLPVQERANLIANFSKTYLVNIIRESGEAAAECLRVSSFLSEHTFGMAFWEYKINYFKVLSGNSLIENVTYAQNDLRFLLGGFEVRCHRVDPESLVPLGGRKLKLETASKGGLLLPGLEEFIISNSAGTLFIGVVADKVEGVQRIFVGLLSQVGKSPHCSPLAEVFNIDTNIAGIDIDTTKRPQEKQRLATRTMPRKVESDEG